MPMLDEVVDSPHATEDAAGAAGAPETIPAETESVVPAPTAETSPVPDQAKPAPLEPGGERFKQVWARAKSAEAKTAELQAELHREREERIRFEELAKASTKTEASPDYTWGQLQGFIDEGRLTLPQALEYRETQMRRSIRKELETDYDTRMQRDKTLSTVQGHMDKYRTLVPDILTPGSETRAKLEHEYRYLTSTLGYPETLQTELAAARMAFGDVETLEKVKPRPDKRGTFMDVPGTGKPSSKSTNPMEGLTPTQVAYFQKMQKAGAYATVDEFKAELAFDAKTRTGRKATS